MTNWIQIDRQKATELASQGVEVRVRMVDGEICYYEKDAQVYEVWHWLNDSDCEFFSFDNLEKAKKKAVSIKDCDLKIYKSKMDMQPWKILTYEDGILVDEYIN